MLNTIKSGDPEAIGNLIGKTAANLIPGGAVVKGIGAVAKIGKGASVVRKILKKLPCGCFIAGTLIFTEAGAMPIEKIEIGHKVWAFNDATGEYGLKEVVKLFQYERDSVYHIAVGKDTIKATADHPFYIGGKWLRVVELKAGDSVKTYDCASLVIERITLVPGRTTVYNFEVADYHTYYVADAKVLVHNNPGPCDVVPGKPKKFVPKQELPSLDATDKVHGGLPKIKDLGKYTKDELTILLGELKQSVQKRIQVTSKMGRDRGHGQRQGAEQDLIKAIEKRLEL